MITVFSCSLLATFGLLILAGCFPDENYNFHTRSFQLSILLTVLIDVNLLLLITGSKRSDTTAEEKDCNSSRRSFLTWTSSLAQSSAMGTMRQKMNDSIAVVTKKKNPKSRHPVVVETIKNNNRLTRKVKAAKARHERWVKIKALWADTAL